MLDNRHNASHLSISVDRMFHVTVNGRLVPGSNALHFSMHQGQYCTVICSTSSCSSSSSSSSSSNNNNNNNFVFLNF